MNNATLNQWNFEDVKVGYEIEPIAFSFSEEDVDDFVKLSGDANPLHVDENFAKSRGFRGRLVHGALIASKFSYLVGMVMPGIGSLYISQELNFHNPVYIGEQCAVKGRVVHKSESTRIIEIKAEIIKSNGELAIDGIAKVKIL